MERGAGSPDCAHVTFTEAPLAAGSTDSQQVVCTNCGSSIRDDAHFCDRCGSRQDPGAQAPTSNAPGVTPTVAQPTVARGVAHSPAGFRRLFAVGPAVLVLAAVVVVVGGVLVIRAATGDGRSAAAVCKVFETDGVALHDRYEGTANSLANNPSDEQLFGGLAELASAPGRFAGLLAKMAAVAPKDIEPQLTTLAEALREAAKNAGDGALNPVGGLVKSIALGLSTQGEVEDVNRYLSDNCTRPT